MANIDEKVPFLKELGFDQDRIDQIKAISERLTKSRQEAGTLVRETTESPATGTEQPTPVAEVKTLEAPFDKEALFKELTEGLVEVLKPIAEAVQLINTRQDALDAKLESQLVKQLTETTPKISFGELLRKSLTGDQSAAIDGRTALGQTSPVPTKQPDVQNITSVPFINGILARQQPQ